MLVHGAFGVRGANGVELLGQRQPLFACAVDGQFVAVDEVIDLRNHRVQQAGHGGDEDEGTHEDACVEMQATQQRGDAVGTGGYGVEYVVRFGGHERSFRIGMGMRARAFQRSGTPRQLTTVMPGEE